MQTTLSGCQVAGSHLGMAPTHPPPRYCSFCAGPGVVDQLMSVIPEYYCLSYFCLMLSHHLYEVYQHDPARYNLEAQCYYYPLLLARAVRGVTAAPPIDLTLPHDDYVPLDLSCPHDQV